MTFFISSIFVLVVSNSIIEVPSSKDYGSPEQLTRFRSNLFVDISIYWEKKLLSLKAYESEMRKYLYSRSIKGIFNLSKRRGNQFGFNLAEPFEVITKLEY